MLTKNNFGKLKKVLIGDFPEHKFMQHHYESLGNKQVWKLYEKIANDSKEDLDNLAILCQDYGVEVYRPKFDPFVTRNWSQIKFKPPFSMSNRFFAYGDLIFYLSQAEDRELVYSGFVRNCLESMHDQGKYVFANPLTLETAKMQDYKEEDWPGNEGFCLDGPCFLPAEHLIFYNRKHCNTNRGIKWIQKIIKRFYPETEFVDVSLKFVNHLDSQIRVYNENLAHSCGSTEYVQKQLAKVYKNIKVLDTSVYEEKNNAFKSDVFSQNKGVFREVEWLKACVDFDDENGNIDTANVSIDAKTVVETYNTLDLYQKLENHGLKVERIPLRHSKFWGSGMCCEIAVLERASE